jgi:hypothetical protein
MWLVHVLHIHKVSGSKTPPGDCYPIWDILLVFIGRSRHRIWSHVLQHKLMAGHSENQFLSIGLNSMFSSLTSFHLWKSVSEQSHVGSWVGMHVIKPRNTTDSCCKQWAQIAMQWHWEVSLDEEPSQTHKQPNSMALHHAKWCRCEWTAQSWGTLSYSFIFSNFW